MPAGLTVFAIPKNAPPSRDNTDPPWGGAPGAGFGGRVAKTSMSPRLLKILSIGVFGKTSRNGFVTDAVMSGCFNSAHESTPKTTSAHSHDVDHHHSFTAINSILGRAFTTML